MSLLLRVHSAAALFTGSHSSVVTCSFFSSSQVCLGIRIGSEMWSEYLLMIDFSFQALRNSSSPSRRCRMTSVPRAGAVDGLDLEVARALAAPAHAVAGVEPGAARFDRDAVGDDEARVEADAELADQVGVLLLVAFELGHELARAALGDGAQVLHGLLGAHADAVVADGDGLGLVVEPDAHLQVGRVLEQLALLSSASKRSLSQASDALETSSRRKISLLEYSEWVTRCRICLTSAWNDRVCLSMILDESG